jgi:hypothetical protein
VQPASQLLVGQDYKLFLQVILLWLVAAVLVKEVVALVDLELEQHL